MRVAVFAACWAFLGCGLNPNDPISRPGEKEIDDASSSECVVSRPTPTKLLFLSNRPGGAADRNFDLYESSLDGSEVSRLTDLPDYSIRWFDRDPESGRIVVAASSDGDLSVGPSGKHGGAEAGEQVIGLLEAGAISDFLIDIRPGGHNPTGFTGVWHPTFSPDGSRIVFSGHRSGESANLWIIHVDGSGLRRLIDDPQRTHQDPRFAPDGRVVFVRHQHRGLAQLTNPNGLDVWILDPDIPGSERPITDEALIPGPAKVETDPAVSPDCKWVASIRATDPISLATVLRPASDNVLFPAVSNDSEPLRVLQRGADPMRIHGVPTWIDGRTILSYRWETDAGGWRIIRFGIDTPDGVAEVMDLGGPVGSQDLLPLAY